MFPREKSSISPFPIVRLYTGAKSFKGAKARCGYLSNYKTSSGSALVIGIFVITVMLLLSSALLNVLDDADEQVNLEVWGTRALAAANSGADHALSLLFPIDGTAGVCSSGDTQWNRPDVSGFHACTVNFTCNENTIVDETQYQIISTAVCQSGELHVSRRVEVQARE